MKRCRADTVTDGYIELFLAIRATAKQSQKVYDNLTPAMRRRRYKDGSPWESWRAYWIERPVMRTIWSAIDVAIEDRLRRESESCPPGVIASAMKA